MTRDRTKHPSLVQRHPKHVVDSALRSLNAHIDRLSHSVLPKHPYLVSVPSDVPYRHSSRFVHTWFIGTPFDRREEQLQYLSFLPHQEDNEELLRVVGGWSDDHGNYLEEEPSPKTAYNSGRNTPLDHSSRKKISLKDYKTKDKMPTDQEPDRSTAPDHNKENIRSPPSRISTQPSEARVKANSTKSEDTQNPSQISVKQPSPPPTSIPSLDGTVSDLPPTTPQYSRDMSPRPSKRRKLSNSQTHKPVKASDQSPPVKAMPQLLSPTLPSPKVDNTLPELLSPLLPPTLVKAIATPPPQSRVENGHQHYRSESVRSILANAISDGSPRPDNRNGPASGSLSGRVRSDSAHSARSATSTGPPTNKAIAALKPSTPNLSPSRSPGPRQRHIIVLKYGKRNRKRVEALIKFHPRPKKVAPPPQDPVEMPIPREVKAQPASVKMSREKSTDIPVKPKPAHDSLNSIKRPTTPVPSIKEPKHSPTSISSRIKSVHATPKKELKSTAMRRVESMEGGDPSTPGAKGRSSTPLSFERSSIPPKSSPGPTSTPHLPNEDRQAWSDMHQKYFQQGRAIKHNATGNNEPGTPKFAVLIVEALLSFMIADAAQTLSRPTADSWSSITDYLRFVLDGTKKHPQLHGLALQMGAICRQQIQIHDIDRMAKDPLPEDYMGSAPTPGSDGNTKTTEDSERYKADYLKNRDRMVKNSRYLQNLWLDGSKRLSPELLRTDYPRTWEARRVDFERRGADRPIPGNIPRNYFLPMDAATNPFEAIRYALTFLTEWADVNGVNWQTRIDL